MLFLADTFFIRIMILDTLQNLKNYTPVHKGIGIVAQFIENNNLEMLAEGRHDLSEGIYASVSVYVTKNAEDTFVESHKQYIDIQVLGVGSEKIGYVPLVHSVVESYNQDKDLQVIRGVTDAFLLKKDMFVVFFPQDGHMPGLCDGEIARVKKIVFKIPV